MDKSKPLVSVCIPTFNGQKYIEDALDSILNQSYPNIEIIISDDNSKDLTLKIIEKYQMVSRFSIKLYHHIPESIGKNWNNSIYHSKGEYIKLFSQDDKLYTTCIEEMVNSILSLDKVEFVFCQRKVINSKSEPNIDKSKFIEIPDVFDGSQIVKGIKILENLEINKKLKNPIGEPVCVLFSRNLFNKVGPFNEKLQQVLDLEYWYRCFLKTDVFFINKQLVEFRIHDEQATQSNSKKITNDKLLFNIFLYKLIKKHFSTYKKIRLTIIIIYDFFRYEIMRRLI